MRARQLPQPVLSKWLDLSEHCEALEDDARKAEAKVRGYVSELARSALPQVRGYAQGQQLDVKWPGDTVDPSRNTGLLLLAALDPSELGELIIRSITKEQPLSASEHAAQVAELE